MGPPISLFWPRGVPFGLLPNKRESSRPDEKAINLSCEVRVLDLKKNGLFIVLAPLSVESCKRLVRKFTLSCLFTKKLIYSDHL